MAHETSADSVDAVTRARTALAPHGLRAWRSGAVHHIDLHVGVPRYFDADRLHEIDDDIRQAALRALEAPGDVLVHFDPCRPRLCSSCAMPDCPVRAAAS